LWCLGDQAWYDFSAGIHSYTSQMIERRGGDSLHVIGKCDLAVFVANDWEAQLDASNLIDVVDPSSV